MPSVGLEELAEACDNWDLKNKIGEGGYGTVFKVLTDICSFFPLLSPHSGGLATSGGCHQEDPEEAGGK